MRVLVVDDVPEYRQMLRDLLELEGCTVLDSWNGDQAWDLFLTERPDLVITDVMHPGLNGVALCQRIRQRGSTPVIVLSAVSPAEGNALLNAGASAFILKPFDPQTLLDCVAFHARRLRGQEPLY